jgi:phosphoribosylformylglycinamidine synthase
VVSGNVSLYNETRGEAVYPTPVVGALGLLEDGSKHAGQGFKSEGDAVVLLGSTAVRGKAVDLAGSEYLEAIHCLVAGKPAIDLRLEAKVQGLCRKAINAGIISSAHDCSDGGLATALAESSIVGGIGFIGEFEVKGRWDAALFGEAQSRIVVSLPKQRLKRLEAMAEEAQVPMAVLGRVGGQRLSIGRRVDLPLSEVSRAWRGGLELALEAQ